MGPENPQLGSKAPLVYIIVLNWNQWRLTSACLEKLKKLDYKGCKVLVVDNGSEDGSKEKLAQLHPELQIIAADKNLGFGAGNNLGIKTALNKSAEYVWLINNDALPEPDALTAMVRLARKRPELGAVGSVVRDAAPPHKVQAWGGGRINLIWGRSRHLKKPAPPGRLSYLIGASMLIRARALEQAGLFDERFFLYFEDADLCQRLRDHGWELAVAKDSTVYHQGNASTAASDEMWARFYTESSKRFFKLHAPCPYLPIISGGLLRMAGALVKGRWGAFIGFAQGQRAARSN